MNDFTLTQIIVMVNEYLISQYSYYVLLSGGMVIIDISDVLKN